MRVQVDLVLNIKLKAIVAEEMVILKAIDKLLKDIIALILKKRLKTILTMFH